jgi:hypothetical protein
MKDNSVIQVTATLDGHDEPALNIEIAKVEGKDAYVVRRLDGASKIYLVEAEVDAGAEVVIAAAMFALTGQRAAKPRKPKAA